MAHRTVKNERKPEARTWPRWVKCVVSFFLLVHMIALLATEAGEFPSSDVERQTASWFAPYILFINQQTAHRYYAPKPGETPIVIFRVRYRDEKRPDETVRFPDQQIRPRIRLQRQLAMAHNVLAEYNNMMNQKYFEPNSPIALLYPVFLARRICRTHPGCASVEVTLRMHNFPPPQIAYEAAATTGTLNLDQESFYGPPIKLGDFTCDELGMP